jgi:galactosylgalactosylxylosylprotein 3-beta-glucuronosyltransferase 3
MAGFALNLSLIHHTNTLFSFKSRIGYQVNLYLYSLTQKLQILKESDFLASFGFKLSDLEPKAENCTKTYVWHTRTEKPKLSNAEIEKFRTRSNLSIVEQDAIF